MSHALEQLQAATLRLAQAGLVKDRLAEAYLHHLSLIEAHQIPEALRAEFAAMCAAMRRERPLPRENPVRASIRKMSNEEANAYAALVVRAFSAVAQAREPASAARPTPAALAPIMQLFAAER